MSGSFGPDGNRSDEMAEYFRLFVDETGEQLDALVEIMLRLEADPTNRTHLNESFRLIHSIKGGSALLGLDQITGLTHLLENHFEQLRSGHRQFDANTMRVTLECVDFLKSCNIGIREGRPNRNDPELLSRVERLEHAAVERPTAEPAAIGASHDVEAGEAVVEDARSSRVIVRLRPELPMAEMKAELLLARLEAIGSIASSQPARADLSRHSGLRELSVVFVEPVQRDAIRAAADVDGVEDVVFDSPAKPIAASLGQSSTPNPSRPESAAGSETVRVDVERLDVLLNLTGELVVNRARLAQLAGDIAPTFRKSPAAGMSAVTHLRDVILERGSALEHDRLVELADELTHLEQQMRTWSEARGRFTELLEAVDQLTRVSTNLQRGVLATRMVPIGPLFSRFRRSVRDIANELGKRVSLDIVGEKTELDKRMIDEIGDPLNHLIRNSIDHGIEPADVRARAHKPEMATVRLTASHRGNNVFITVEDDGGGIDTDRVRQTAVARGLLSRTSADSLVDDDLFELIWQPGFSTASKVSDISGRGVGMDIVRTKIAGLNGSIHVESQRRVGTRFTIRLPLTLTIARCMLFRVAEGVFAVPIENVREIVSTVGLRTVAVNGRTLCDVRGEMLPLAGLRDLFRWHGPSSGAAEEAVLVLQSGHRCLGLLAEALLGGQDVVIKPLDEKFLHVRGLGGASVLGDGSICLLLDTAACIDAAQPERIAATGSSSRERP